MAQQTYNPITKRFSSKPEQSPGTVVVAYINGKATEVKDESSDFWENAFGFGSIAITPIATAAMFWLYGWVGFVYIIVVVAVIVAIIYLLSEILRVGQSTYYLVDISRQAILDERRAQLADHGIFAVVDFEYRATVCNPTTVVDRGIKDVRAYLSDRFYVAIDSLVRNHTLDQLQSLRAAIKNVLENVKKDD